MPRWKEPRPIRIDGGIAIITLTRGYETIIDAKDALLVKDNDWMATVSSAGKVYATRSFKSGKKSFRVYLHRQLMDAPDDLQVDHKDLDTLNNRRQNLRVATASQNAANKRAKKNNPSGLKGAFFLDRASSNAKNWFSTIRKDGKDIYLGVFDTPEEAHRAYADAANRLFGRFARVA